MEVVLVFVWQFAIVIGLIRLYYHTTQLITLKEYMAGGGKVLLLGNEDADHKATMITAFWNKLSEEFGIRINNDAVIRTVFAKDQLHPKVRHD